MLKLVRSGVVLMSLSGACLLGVVACDRGSSSSNTNTGVAPAMSSAAVAADPGPIPVSIPKPANTAASVDPYKRALDKADGARNISQSAQSKDDWNMVVSRWQQAIQLMRSVPASSPYRSLVKPKLAEYQRSLAYAKKQVVRVNSSEIAVEPSIIITDPTDPIDNPPISPAPTRASTDGSRVASRSSGTERVYRARIKRREGGTPVIDVTFNGRQTFEMIVDTGASGTVITERMAAALGTQVIGKAKVDTASDRGVEVPLALVKSIAVGGAVVKEVVVAIGSSALDTGLLGHDFFGEYDVTVKRDVVEFRPR